MLSTASSYFRAAFDGNFKEGQEGCLKLADEDSDTFDIILRAIYAEQLVHDKPAEEAHAVKKAIYAMIKVYIACDKYDLPAFKPPALDALTRYHDILRKKLGKGPCFGAIPLIYNNTTEASILREFITRRAASSCLRTGGKGHKEFAATILAGLPDFAADFVKTLVRAAGKTYDDPLTWPLEEPKPTEGPPQKEMGQAHRS